MNQEPFTDDGWYVAGTEGKPTLLLLPGLGVSYQIFFPLIELLKEEFRFTLGRCTRFDSVDGQAGRVIDFIRTQCGGHVDCIYGLSLGGKILSRVLERNEVTVDHAIMDAAPLLPLPRWLEGPLRYYQSFNVWTCYHWTGVLCSTHTTLTCCLTSAARCSRLAVGDPCWMVINRSIPISWRLFMGPISTSGTAPKSRSWLSRRRSICLGCAHRPILRCSRE